MPFTIDDIEPEIDIWKELLDDPAFNILEQSERLNTVSLTSDIPFITGNDLSIDQYIPPVDNVNIMPESANKRKRDNPYRKLFEPRQKNLRMSEGKNEYLNAAESFSFGTVEQPEMLCTNQTTSHVPATSLESPSPVVDIKTSKDYMRIRAEIHNLREQSKKAEEKYRQELSGADKKDFKRLRNKLSASLSRINQKVKNLESEEMILTLQHTVSNLKSENILLHQRINDLQNENSDLKKQDLTNKTLQFSTQAQSEARTHDSSWSEGEDTKKVNSFFFK